MIDTTLDELRALIKKELTVYNTMSSLPSDATSDAEEDSRANAESFSIRIGPKRRRLQPAADAEADANDRSRGIRPRWRVKMIEWAFKVIDFLDLDREIVTIATNYLDRFCLVDSRPDGIDRNTLQLLTLTCLYIAIKLFEFRAIRSRGATETTTLESLLHIIGSTFTKQEMESMEYEILDTLQWQVHPPTEQIFIKYFMECSGDSSKVLKLSTYLTEVALLDSFFASYRTSETAFAALLFSRGRILHEGEAPFSLKLSQANHHDFDLQNPRIKECYDRISTHFSNSVTHYRADSRGKSPASVTAF